MINSKKFSERLQKLIDFYGLSASAFAERIGVQRSSISHILSGRNKPSLDFVLKVIQQFPDVELYWLLNGKGIFPSISKTHTFSSENASNDDDTISNRAFSKTNSGNEIERIIIFYRDGTFKNFIN